MRVLLKAVLVLGLILGLGLASRFANAQENKPAPSEPSQDKKSVASETQFPNKESAQKTSEAGKDKTAAQGDAKDSPDAVEGMDAFSKSLQKDAQENAACDPAPAPVA